MHNVAQSSLIFSLKLLTRLSFCRQQWFWFFNLGLSISSTSNSLFFIVSSTIPHLCPGHKWNLEKGVLGYLYNPRVTKRLRYSRLYCFFHCHFKSKLSRNYSKLPPNSYSVLNPLGLFAALLEVGPAHFPPFDHYLFLAI